LEPKIFQIVNLNMVFCWNSEFKSNVLEAPDDECLNLEWNKKSTLIEEVLIEKKFSEHFYRGPGIHFFLLRY